MKLNTLINNILILKGKKNNWGNRNIVLLKKDRNLLRKILEEETLEEILEEKKCSQSFNKEDWIYNRLKLVERAILYITRCTTHFYNTSRDIQGFRKVTDPPPISESMYHRAKWPEQKFYDS